MPVPTEARDAADDTGPTAPLPAQCAACTSAVHQRGIARASTQPCVACASTTAFRRTCQYISFSSHVPAHRLYIGCTTPQVLPYSVCITALLHLPVQQSYLSARHLAVHGLLIGQKAPVAVHLQYIRFFNPETSCNPNCLGF